MSAYVWQISANNFFIKSYIYTYIFTDYNIEKEKIN